MYIIDRDPSEVIPDITEKMIETKFILAIIQDRAYKWISILGYSNNEHYLLSWYGNANQKTSGILYEWGLGNKHGSDDRLITKLINTWKDTRCCNQTTFFICDTIQEVKQVLNDNIINKWIESQIVEFCEQRSFVC